MKIDEETIIILHNEKGFTIEQVNEIKDLAEQVIKRNDEKGKLNELWFEKVA